ncbi:MAG: hypothetical protein OEN00_09585 [Gemmatimonadota bacterium]|nr:hypothetical protein [Gemmatimonadota bacterium]
MRFAYIDSQGNEVPIPSVDALALRIELGAVGPDTELYDAQADHWGPARTHEIFVSLSRDVGEEGFMAPPPVAAPAVSAAPTSPAPAPEKEAEPEEKESDEFDLGLTLADPQPEPPEDEAAGSADKASSADLGLDLARPVQTPTTADSEALDLQQPSSEAGGGFDFGDLGSTPLALEANEPLHDDPLGGGMGLETEMGFSGPAADFEGGGGDLELEQPMSAFEPDSPPGWMDESGPDEVMDFSAVTAEEEASQEAVVPAANVPTRQRSTPKDRPSKPRFKSQRSMSGPIVSVVVLMALAVGGYYGWPFLTELLAGRSAPERPVVVMPAIPAELLPEMRSVGMAAIADVVSEVNEATRIAGVPIEPAEEWLAGVYLGNASQFVGVEAFWLSIDDLMQGMRAADWQLYHDKYVERLGQAGGLVQAAAAQVTERADSGFVAASPERSAAYAEMESLVDAALDLHAFLLQNEARIEFRPGLTSATDPNVDPVLEISAPAEDRARMLEMFEDITDALDALGSLERVTRDRLTSALTARLQQVGLQ